METRLVRVAGLLLACLAPAWSATVDLATCGFVSDAEVAMSQAREGNKLVFVDFSTSWCVWCRRLEQDVFSTAEFRQGTADWVKLSLDAEKEGAGVDWAKRFHVSGYPTTVLLNPDGSEIDRMSGYAPMPTFLQVFRDYAEGKGTLAALQAERVHHPEDLELAWRVLEKLEGRKAEGWRTEAQTLVGRDAGNKAGFAARAAGMLALADHREQKSPAPLEEFVSRYGSSEPGLEARSILVSHYRRAEDLEGAKRHLGAVLAEHGENAQALNSYAWTCTELEWNLESALEAARKADRLAPGDVQVIDTVAEVLFKLGRNEEAIREIDRALVIDPASDYLKGQRTKFGGL